MKATARCIGTVAMFLVAVPSTAMPTPAAPVNLVQNPGFELGAASWTLNSFSLLADPLWTHSGATSAISYACPTLACLDHLFAGSYVSQLLPTTPGAQYDLDFWVRSFRGDAAYSVFWDGALIDTSKLVNGPMTHASYLGLSASANFTLLEVHGRNRPYPISFDDFSVVRSAATPPPPVPEAASYLTLLAGLGVVGLALRRRRT